MIAFLHNLYLHYKILKKTLCCKSKIIYSSLDSAPIYQKGISVLIPTKQGQETIKKSLQSIENQNISSNLFELIIVINGELDGTIHIINNFKKENPFIQVKVSFIEEANLSKARNMCIKLASFSHCVFLDDDDYISENYLSAIYKIINPKTVVFVNIIDVKNDETVESSINTQINNARNKKSIKITDLTSVSTMNACKAIPTSQLKSLSYNENLKSGEDVSFFTNFFIKHANLKLQIIPANENAVYYRVIRNNSVSRKPESFEFNVIQRAQVISDLYDILEYAFNLELKLYCIGKINAQAGFIKRYIEKNPDQYKTALNVLEKILKKKNPDIPNLIGEKKVLFINYCFPPYIDTSAINSMKRIINLDLNVDVISGNMESVRKKDERLLNILSSHIKNYKKINTATSFSDWRAIKNFTTICFEESISLIESNNYSMIYSRVMWPASNFPAAILKIKTNIFWYAEFSDPIYIDSEKKERKGNLEKKWLVENNILNIINKKGYKIPDTNNLFFWCEHLAYVLADKIAFTNDKQKEFMINKIECEKLKNDVSKKCTVIQHNTLPSKYYKLSNFQYKLDKRKINLLYSGMFYKQRGIKELIDAIGQLDITNKEKIILHIFTEQRKLVKENIPSNLQHNIVINDYIGYFDILSLFKQFDCLVVADSTTVNGENPYLPSKLSDYLGCSTDIWIIYEKNSCLSEMEHKNIKYKSIKNDITDTIKVLNNIISDKEKIKELLGD